MKSRLYQMARVGSQMPRAAERLRGTMKGEPFANLTHTTRMTLAIPAQNSPRGGPRTIISTVIQTTHTALMTAPGTNMSNVR